MEKKIEKKGSSIPQIIADFKKEHNLSEDKFTYDIIEEGKKTFFGIFRKSPVVMEFTLKNVEKPKEKQRMKMDKPKINQVKHKSEKADNFRNNKANTANNDRISKNKNKREVLNKERKGTEKVKTKEEKKPIKKKIENNKGKKDKIFNSELTNEVTLFLKDFFKQLDEKDLVFNSFQEENYQHIQVSNFQNPGFFIGKEGRMIDAIQNIVNCMLENRLSRPENELYRDMQVIIDLENYRKKHEKSIQSLTKNIIEKVKNRRKSITLEPMTSADRRIVHKYVENDEDIKTMTVGKGNMKRIVLYSADEKDKEKPKHNKTRVRENRQPLKQKKVQN